jgi:hypothetical protein
VTTGLEPESIKDVGVFLARLVRLNPAALVRLKPSGDRVALWARLPFDVLVTRLVAGSVGSDATFRAGDLLASLPNGPLPDRRDADWRGPLPLTGDLPLIESVPVDVVRSIAASAARTLEDAVGRGTGERRVRDAILDHIAITLSDEGHADVAVPTRVVTGLARMGFLGDGAVRFRAGRGWLCAQATYGAVWFRRAVGLELHPVGTGN